MTLRVVGAGLGRTGTLSLKVALERLLGAPCYHMLEVFEHPEHVPLWHGAARGRMPDWAALFEGYAACVDWPAAAFWPEIAAAFPDALVLLSERASEGWWRSANATILPALRHPVPPEMAAWHDMARATIAHRFTDAIDDEAACRAAFDAHNVRVREQVPGERLLVWRPGDGWEPICERLGLPVPAEPFPHRNSTEEFLQTHVVGPRDA